MMSFKSLITVLVPGILLTACAAQRPAASPTPEDDRTIAFPGAEGFGKYTTGGRGGKVCVVTNLEDHGPGSFREAAEAKYPRIIVFAVSGTIHLEKKLGIQKNATIAGQTAPGDGICLADESVSLAGDNIIVRYLRFRMGDKNQRGGMVDGNGGDDAFGGVRRKNIVVDHCTMSWSTDEACSIYGGDSTTLQWNLITEPLNYSYHFETGDKDYEHHGFGGIWGGSHLSAHHNLFAHCASRNPRFNGARLGAKDEFVDFRNNVIYDWGHNNIYGGEGGVYNIVNNYFRYGPNTSPKVRFRIVNPSKTDPPGPGFGNYYVSGNYVDESPEVTRNNWEGIHMGNDATEDDKRNAVVDKAFATIIIPEESAVKAYQEVLEKVGASFSRDTLDQRIIREVKSRTGRYIDVQGGYPHGTDYAQTVNAWPSLQSKPAPQDSDGDGMPDEWEKKNGLNPNDGSDASVIKPGEKYTNVERYINSLVK